MATKLITTKAKTNFGDLFKDSTANNNYYFFVGNHTESSNTLIEDVEFTVNDLYLQPFNNMIQGKLIQSSDICPIIEKKEYTSNTIYDMYEHDVDLSEADYYVSVDEGSYIHVYKCLDNNLGGYSTIQPTFSHISGANTQFYRTSDGYAWKYMYSFSDAQDLKFGSAKYIPVIANSTVTSAAQQGVIDVIKVEGAGRKYDNYITGSFGTGEIAYGGNATVYQLASDARNSNSFYSGCLMYLSSGTGSGQYRTITDYFSNNTGKFAVINNAFTTVPTNGTQYQIYPKVNVYGNGRETANVVARALVNALSTNSIYRVEILNKGSGFTFAVTANVYANSVVGVQAAAELKVVLPPSGGHGYDIENELQAKRLEISVTLANTEANTITTQNGFRQIGIVQNPLFANVSLNVSNVFGTFSNGEIVSKIEPMRLFEGASMNTTSNVVTVSALDVYNNGITAGETLYLATNTTGQLATVNSVINSTAIQLTVNGFFLSSNATVYLANKTPGGYLYFSNGVAIRLANVSPIFGADDIVVGESSGAKGKVTGITRAGKDKGFDTFINMHKYVGSLTSGTFTENEIIYSGSLATANAILHSAQTVNSEFVIYASNQYGIINSTVVGANSSAIASITSTYSPELQFNSGKVLYVENADRIERSANTSEQFQIIFEF